MVDLALLGFSIAVGMPTGLYLDEKIKEKYLRYKKKETLRKDFKGVLEGLNIPLKIHDIWEDNENIGGELEGSYKLYKLNMKIKDFINKLGVYDGEFTGMDDYIFFRFSKSKPKDMFELYQYIPLPPTTLLLGYGDKGIITADMKKVPHLLCVGNSNSGKTYCIETALKNLRGADITLLNAFEDDFIGVKAKRINDIGDIQKYLIEQIENKEKRDRPQFVVIDEFNVLSTTRGMDKLLMELLAQARHYNVYLIVIAQRGNSEDIKYKGLFNTRLCFRTIEEATRKAVLGVTTETTPQPRHFYMATDSLYCGQTFTLR